MNLSNFHGLRCLGAVALAFGLSGCLGAGAPNLTSLPPRPDPPPIPLRKPAPPMLQAQGVQIRGVQPQGTPQPSGQQPVVVTTPVEVQSLGRASPVTAAPAAQTSLAPARKPVTRAAASNPAPNPTPTPAAMASYRVQPGDTVYGVARRFAVPARAVIEANALTPPYGLRVGQTLRIPNPRRHVVRAGDSIYGVARHYGVEPSQLVRLNRIGAPYRLSPGQTLILPPRRIATTSAPKPRATAAGQAPVGAAVIAASAKGKPPAPARTAAATPITRANAVILRPPPRAGGKFLWPTRGRTIAGYGAKKDGLHNDGINIAAPRGAPVYAAENGVVAYTGNELRGFGNLILIKHAGGWVTAYAHTDRYLVERGDRVQRGQVIAHVGSSGTVATPQLHFEIRKGTRSVDPVRLLGPQKADAS